MYLSEPFTHLVDDYLGHLHEVAPGSASLDGVHLHDDLLEDLSRPAIEGNLRALAGFGRRLRQIDVSQLTAGEKIDHRILVANLDARVFDLDQVRIWERSPQYYADILATSLAGQMLFAYAPERERGRRVLSKLRQVPRFVQAARDNIKEPAGIFVKVAQDTWRGVVDLIERDIPRAFGSLDDLHLLGDLADASTEAIDSIRGYQGYLETDLAPRAKASFRLGRANFEQKLRLEEGISLDADRLLQIVLRELNAVQEQFRQAAGKLGSGDPVELWRQAKSEHPAAGTLVKTAGEQVREVVDFLNRHNLVTMPTGESVITAPSPGFYRWAAASMWTPGPFEARPSRGRYYVTDVDRAWSEERQQEYLRDLNFATLWNITIHETYPGHYLHAQRLRDVESKVRKSRLFASGASIEGWAHYCEQMVVDAGFRKGEVLIRVGQLSKALIRLARCVVAIRLHCEDLSVEQGVRIFKEEAFLEDLTARREAERGTFDPMYVVYALGKQMLLKLRRDSEDELGARFSLRTFHDTLLAQGAAPFWAHRQLMLGTGADALLE
jgi:hypothetical protein